MHSESAAAAIGYGVSLFLRGRKQTQMTNHSHHPIPVSGQRVAGQLAIISGVFGFLAFGCLMAFLLMRPSNADQDTAHLLLRSHDVGIVIQSLCLIPLALSLDATTRYHATGSGRTMAVAAVTFLVLIVVLMLLSFVNVVADVLYMIPQGAMGAWIIAVCGHRKNALPRSLRILGTVAGTGLVLISLFPIGYSLFVDSAILKGPISDQDPTPPGTDSANTFVHVVLAIGTLLGCSTYPIWSAAVGRWFLRLNRNTAPNDL